MSLEQLEGGRRTVSEDDYRSDKKSMKDFLKSGLSVPELVTFLRYHTKTNANDIEKIVKTYVESRKKLQKNLQHFITKLQTKYSTSDPVELERVSYKHAKKNGFNDVETEAFISLLHKRDIAKLVFPYDDMEYTEMAKLFGYGKTDRMAEILPVDNKDMPVLDNIRKLYTNSIDLSRMITHQSNNYKNASSFLDTKYDNTKHHLFSAINPLIFGLFASKIKQIDDRMLITNFGRLITSKTMHVALEKPESLYQGITDPAFLEDQKLQNAMVNDPNSMNFYSNDSALANILKRFKIQISLWQTVMALRTGNLYSKNDQNALLYFGSANQNDAINILLTTLDSYEWHYYDSPELVTKRDESKILLKLLAVFSLRPTVVLMRRETTGILPIGNQNLNLNVNNMYEAGRRVPIPFVTVRTPIVSQGGQLSVKLSDSLNSNEQMFVAEQGHIIQKSRKVIYSNKLLMFYVSRQKNIVLDNSSNLFYEFNANDQLQVLDNDEQEAIVDFEPQMQVGEKGENLVLRSIITSTKTNPKKPLTSVAFFDVDNAWYKYDPIDPALMTSSDENEKRPIKPIAEGVITENEKAKKEGIIFVYNSNI